MWKGLETLCTTPGSVNTCCLAPAEDRYVHCFILFTQCLLLSQHQAVFVLEAAAEGLANHLWLGTLILELEVNWRHESASSSVQHAGGRWYINMFSYYSRRENSWESKSFFFFFFLQKFKLMNGKNQQTSEILFDKQDFVLLKKKKNLAMLKAATSH